MNKFLAILIACTTAASAVEPSSSEQWTIDTLRAHVLALMHAQEKQTALALAEQEKAVSAALAAADKATLKAEEAAERHRVAQNEWRGAMNDRERNFITKSEVYSGVGAVAGVIMIYGFMQTREKKRPTV